MKCQVTREKVLKSYVKVYKEHKEVNYELLKKEGIIRHNVRQHFFTISQLHKEAREIYPAVFDDVILEKIVSTRYNKSILNDIKGYKRLFVTTAVVGGKVPIEAYKTVKNFCKLKNAKMLVLVASDGSLKEETLDKLISTEFIVKDHIHLNKNLTISPIKINSRSADPLTGLERISQKHGSSVYASPKQRLKFVPISNTGVPRAIMTTGAITLPNYKAKTFLSEKSTLISDADHILGGIIIELEDDRLFHFRQVQFDSKGSFIDLGLQYSPTGKPKKIMGCTFIPGDYHGDSADPSVIKCYQEISKQIDFDKIVVHDLFDGKSVNPHELDDIVMRTQRAEKGELCLRDEIKGTVRDIDTLLRLGKRLVIVASNHNDFLERYLRKGLYVEDPLNHRLCLDVACRVLDGEDGLKAAVEIVNGRKVPGPIEWLKVDEDYKIAGCQMGAHGHLGSSGTKGTLRAMELAYNDSFTGHTHAAEILRNSWRVGTTTFLQLSYNFGPSAWTNTAGILYPNGQRQLLNIIFGKWKI